MTNENTSLKDGNQQAKDFEENWKRNKKWEERLTDDSIVVRNWKNKHTGSTLRVIEKENPGTNSFVLNFSGISVHVAGIETNLMEGLHNRELAIQRAKEFMEDSPKGTLIDESHEPQGDLE